VRNEAIRNFVHNEIPDTDPVPMQELYPDASPHACDLLTKLLAFDPSQRYAKDTLECAKSTRACVRVLGADK
jgi:serine/threonine protein kinase